MSMENAILELAASLRYLADSNRRDLADSATLIQESKKVDPVQEKAGELAEITGKLAKGKADAELEQAVQKVEADTKKNVPAESSPADSAAASTNAAGAPSDDQPALDYVKDIRPTLLAAIKKAGKEKVEAMIKTFGVDKADKVDPAKYGELLAGAHKLAA